MPHTTATARARTRALQFIWCQSVPVAPRTDRETIVALCCWQTAEGCVDGSTFWLNTSEPWCVPHTTATARARTWALHFVWCQSVPVAPRIDR